MDLCFNRSFPVGRPQPHSRSPRSLSTSPFLSKASRPLPSPGPPCPRKRTSARRRWKISASRATSAPEASLKLDAIESGYAVPLIRLNLHVWCIDLSIRPRRSAPRVRWFAEPAQSIERKRFKEPTGPLLWAREAGPRVNYLTFPGLSHNCSWRILSMKELANIRTDVVGSLLRPAHLKQARLDFDAGKITAEEMRRIEDQEIRQAVAMQEAIGLEGVTDGERSEERRVGK